jgi:uncharacterized protein YbaR (Trm112 family)
MDKKLMDIICCPVCKGELELKVTNQEANEIIEGKLICHKCDFPYPIEEGIPNLLPPEYHKKED